MKKAKKVATGKLRPAYERSDFPSLVRGKYIERLRKSSNIVVLEPDVAGLFPNAAAVNAALRSLVEIARRAASPSRGSRYEPVAPSIEAACARLRRRKCRIGESMTKTG